MSKIDDLWTRINNIQAKAVKLSLDAIAPPRKRGNLNTVPLWDVSYYGKISQGKKFNINTYNPVSGEFTQQPYDIKSKNKILKYSFDRSSDIVDVITDGMDSFAKFSKDRLVNVVGNSKTSVNLGGYQFRLDEFGQILFDPTKINKLQEAERQILQAQKSLIGYNVPNIRMSPLDRNPDPLTPPVETLIGIPNVVVSVCDESGFNYCYTCPETIQEINLPFIMPIDDKYSTWIEAGGVKFNTNFTPMKTPLSWVPIIKKEKWDKQLNFYWFINGNQILMLKKQLSCTFIYYVPYVFNFPNIEYPYWLLSKEMKRIMMAVANEKLQSIVKKEVFNLNLLKIDVDEITTDLLTGKTAFFLETYKEGGFVGFGGTIKQATLTGAELIGHNRDISTKMIFIVLTHYETGSIADLPTIDCKVFLSNDKNAKFLEETYKVTILKKTELFTIMSDVSADLTKLKYEYVDANAEASTHVDINGNEVPDVIYYFQNSVFGSSTKKFDEPPNLKALFDIWTDASGMVINYKTETVYSVVGKVINNAGIITTFNTGSEASQSVGNNLVIDYGMLRNHASGLPLRREDNQVLFIKNGTNLSQLTEKDMFPIMRIYIDADNKMVCEIKWGLKFMKRVLIRNLLASSKISIYSRDMTALTDEYSCLKNKFNVGDDKYSNSIVYSEIDMTSKTALPKGIYIQNASSDEPRENYVEKLKDAIIIPFLSKLPTGKGVVIAKADPNKTKNTTFEVSTEKFDGLKLNNKYANFTELFSYKSDNPMISIGIMNGSETNPWADGVSPNVTMVADEKGKIYGDRSYFIGGDVYSCYLSGIDAKHISGYYSKVFKVGSLNVFLIKNIPKTLTTVKEIFKIDSNTVSTKAIYITLGNSGDAQNVGVSANRPYNANLLATFKKNPITFELYLIRK
jgi:hypothetical protein